LPCRLLTRREAFTAFFENKLYDEARDYVRREVCFLTASTWTDLTLQVPSRDSAFDGGVHVTRLSVLKEECTRLKEESIREIVRLKEESNREIERLKEECSRELSGAKSRDLQGTYSGTV
jgi:hypothetical protein